MRRPDTKASFVRRVAWACALLACAAHSQTAWQQLNPVNNPGAGIRYEMVYDSARDRVVLHGNRSTWEFDGKDWSLINANLPGPEYQFNMVYDAARRQTLLFGGNKKGPVTNELWAYDGSSWRRLAPASSPPARCCAAMAYDSRRQRVVLFGGFDYRGFLSDTWEWDGASWREIKPPTAFIPPPRCCMSMVYDAASGVMVMFGGGAQVSTGDLNDTWVYPGAIWLNARPATNPPPRRAHSMMYDSARSRVVLFGGGVGGNGSPKLGDTWEWDGKDWTRIATGAAPAARFLHALAFDSRRARGILYGGTPNQRDTWEYGGTLLRGDVHELSLSQGGVQSLALRAGAAHSGRPFLILGSASGTYPGITQGAFRLPLNPDPYLWLLLSSPNSYVSPSFGTLDNVGNAASAFRLPAGMPAALQGLQLHHAYAVASGTALQLTSNPVPVTLIR